MHLHLITLSKQNHATEQEIIMGLHQIYSSN